nr:MAG TPA: hypothetical protein [Bacteriophage sp.]
MLTCRIVTIFYITIEMLLWQIVELKVALLTFL